MFNFIDDIEDWLEPMDYETFWTEIKTFCLILMPREKCDADIADGAVTEEGALNVLKTLARIELTRILKLQRNTDPIPMQSKAKH
jgi:hypothetical protein